MPGQEQLLVSVGELDKPSPKGIEVSLSQLGPVPGSERVTHVGSPPIQLSESPDIPGTKGLGTPPGPPRVSTSHVKPLPESAVEFAKPSAKPQAKPAAQSAAAAPPPKPAPAPEPKPVESIGPPPAKPPVLPRELRPDQYFGNTPGNEKPVVAHLSEKPAVQKPKESPRPDVKFPGFVSTLRRFVKPETAKEEPPAKGFPGFRSSMKRTEKKTTSSALEGIHDKFPAAAQASTPVAERPHQDQPQPVTRTTETTVADSMKFSPLKQTAKPTGNRVVVSIPDKKVVVYGKDGSEVMETSVYIGTASSPTPRGQFRIMENIVPDKSEWYYGGHWMGFAKDYDQSSKKGGVVSYAGFHGWVYTKDDDEIEKEEPGWKTTTHGCVQLSNKEMARMASLLGPGDPVMVIDAPITPPPARPPQVAMKEVSPMSSVFGMIR